MLCMSTMHDSIDMTFFSAVNVVFHPLAGPYVHPGLDEVLTASQAIISKYVLLYIYRSVVAGKTNPILQIWLMTNTAYIYEYNTKTNSEFKKNELQLLQHEII